MDILGNMAFLKWSQEQVQVHRASESRKLLGTARFWKRAKTESHHIRNTTMPQLCMLELYLFCWLCNGTDYCLPIPIITILLIIGRILVWPINQYSLRESPFKRDSNRVRHIDAQAGTQNLQKIDLFQSTSNFH